MTSTASSSTSNTAPPSLGTLSEFLLQAGTEYFIIDLSRGRRIIDNQDFFDYELNKQTYPRTRQGHAWFSVVFWNKTQKNAENAQEHYIWFLKLPVDEVGLIMQSARDQFLHIVVDALGREMQNIEERQAQLPENPFVFTPSQQQLADCNASIRKHLNLAPRPGLEKALSYIKAPNIQPWDELSVQDMSDLAVNADKDEIKRALVQNLEILPQAVCLCLLSSFEGLDLSSELVTSLLAYHKRCDKALKPLILRALAMSQNQESGQYIKTLINNTWAGSQEDEQKTLDTETLVVIAGRHWQLLIPDTSSSDLQKSLLTQFLEIVARQSTKQAKLQMASQNDTRSADDNTYMLFRGIFSDLVMLPDLRVFMLALLREPEHTEPLRSALKSLFTQEKT